MGKEPTKMQEMQETQAQFLVKKVLWRRKMAAHFSIIAWRIHGQRSLVGYSPWGQKESAKTEANEHKYV